VEHHSERALRESSITCDRTWQSCCSRSQERLATDQEFGYIREDIEQFRRQQALNAVSLESSKHAFASGTRKTRGSGSAIQERRARTAPEPVVYELTLKQVALPGLPEPVAKTNTGLRARM
jgi:hypothetical protein